MENEGGEEEGSGRYGYVFEVNKFLTVMLLDVIVYLILSGQRILFRPLMSHSIGTHPL